nr:aspartate carbamoyltransferase regulatory subunit [Frisingicoccus sp.]
MLNISGIEEGYVIDHIRAGKSMDIYKYLRLDKLDCQVAIIKNASSNKMGKKDIIKVQGNMNLDLNILGFIDDEITVNIIKGGKIVKKEKPELPKTITNVIRCKNPRCISSVEQELPQIFKLTDPEAKTYRCIYCEEKFDMK